jgi:hypothetical protein
VPRPDGRFVKISASRDQCLHDRCSVWFVPRPVGEKMRRRPPTASMVFDHAPGKSGIGRKQLTQPLDLALLERRCDVGRELARRDP